MTEKRKSLPRKPVAGIHFPIPLNGKALEVGLLYSFPKMIKVKSHRINKNPKVERENTFTQARLKEICDDCYYFVGHPKNCCPNENHELRLTKRQIRKLHAKVNSPSLV